MNLSILRFVVFTNKLTFPARSFSRVKFYGLIQQIYFCVAIGWTFFFFCTATCFTVSFVHFYFYIISTISFLLLLCCLFTLVPFPFSCYSVVLPFTLASLPSPVTLLSFFSPVLSTSLLVYSTCSASSTSVVFWNVGSWVLSAGRNKIPTDIFDKVSVVTYARIAFQLHVYQWTRHGPLEPAVTCSTPL